MAMMVKNISAIFALLLGGSLAYSNSLTNDSNKGNITVQVKVPKEAEVYKSTKLECNWRLYGDGDLYSVKWYKDEYEFFSYNPDNHEQKITTQTLNGVTVDEHKSKKNEVWLTDLSLNSSGQYKCEVSTGAPFFRTNYVTSNLTVISLPTHGPEIRGFGTQYALGENVTANCTAWPSVPQAKIVWYVNNKEVEQRFVIQHKPYSRIDSQGTPNTLGLRFEVGDRHMAGSGGILKLKCVSWIGSRKQETERTATITHANNQRYSAGDLRNRASILSVSSLVMLVVVVVT